LLKVPCLLNLLFEASFLNLPLLTPINFTLNWGASALTRWHDYKDNTTHDLHSAFWDTEYFELEICSASDSSYYLYYIDVYMNVYNVSIPKLW